MEKLQIQPLNIEKDIPTIKLWQKDFASNPKYKYIQHFILEDNTYYGLDEVILTNYEFFHIGNDEKKFCLSIKNESKLTIGFILACVFNISVNKPELIIQYIVLNPDYQNKGYGTSILNELLTNAEEHFGLTPEMIYANIEQDNIASYNLFKKFGFSFTKTQTNYLRAQKHTKQLQEEKI